MLGRGGGVRWQQRVPGVGARSRRTHARVSSGARLWALKPLLSFRGTVHREPDVLFSCW